MWTRPFFSVRARDTRRLSWRAWPSVRSFPSFLPLISVDLIAIQTGAYVVISIQSLQFLLNSKRAHKGRRIMLGYSAFMFGVVATWYCLGATVNSVYLVEGLIDPDVLNSLTTCDGLGISREIFNTLIIWSGDGLLVRRLPGVVCNH
jgi:hypothetical protein